MESFEFSSFRAVLSRIFSCSGEGLVMLMPRECADGGRKTSGLGLACCGALTMYLLKREGLPCYLNFCMGT